MFGSRLRRTGGEVCGVYHCLFGEAVGSLVTRYALVIWGPVPSESEPFRLEKKLQPVNVFRDLCIVWRDP